MLIVCGHRGNDHRPLSFTVHRLRPWFFRRRGMRSWLHLPWSIHPSQVPFGRKQHHTYEQESLQTAAKRNTQCLKAVRTQSSFFSEPVASRVGSGEIIVVRPGNADSIGPEICDIDDGTQEDDATYEQKDLTHSDSPLWNKTESVMELMLAPKPIESRITGYSEVKVFTVASRLQQLERHALLLMLNERRVNTRPSHC